MIAARLTEQQAQEINGTDRGDGVYFSPIQDVHGDWFISAEEHENCSIEWIKSLPLIEFKPIINTEIP